MFKAEGVLNPLDRLHRDDIGAEHLGSSDSYDIGMYKANTDKLSIRIKAKTNFMKNPHQPALFPAKTFYTSVKTSLEELSTVFVDHHIDCTEGFVESLTVVMSYRGPTSIALSNILCYIHLQS